MNVVDSFLSGLDPQLMLGARELSKLRWRCRRGLLENDLMIESFFNRFEKDPIQFWSPFEEYKIEKTPSLWPSIELVDD